MATNTKLALAKAFSRRLIEEIGPEKTAEAVERNKTYPDSACASHDFCDANMVMAAAFEEVVGRETELNDDEDIRLWDRAWDLAADNKFWM